MKKKRLKQWREDDISKDIVNNVNLIFTAVIYHHLLLKKIH